MNAPQSKAVYMPAPDQSAGNTKLPLATRRPSIHATDFHPQRLEPRRELNRPRFLDQRRLEFFGFNSIGRIISSARKDSRTKPLLASIVVVSTL